MPTFTAIAFDRLIEPGASKSVDKSAPTSMPVPNSKLDRRSSTPSTKKKASRPQLKPALYATPEVTPLPDSPSSFPPSPYIINHKRRGPRLLKSLSEANVQSKQKIPDDEMVNGKPKNSDTVVVSSAGDLQVTFSNPEAVKEEPANDIHDNEPSRINNSDLASGHREAGGSSNTNGSLWESIIPKVAYNLERDGESEDFFDPQDSMSYTSNTDGEDNAATEHSVKISTPRGEFFDAWEELSSEGGALASPSPYDVEAELCQMRLSLLMEIEKRKQAEESLNNMQSQWESIRERLSHVGIILPAGLVAVAEGEQLNSDPVEDVCEQVHVARFVSDAIGRGIARAEVEMEMEAQLDSKNFEIARLLERLRFYEMVNQEMSQRNQEAIEMARRERQRRSRRQRWVWGSITTAIVLGVATIAWSYLPLEKGSCSADHDQVSEHCDSTK